MVKSWDFLNDENILKHLINMHNKVGFRQFVHFEFWKNLIESKRVLFKLDKFTIFKIRFVILTIES